MSKILIKESDLIKLIETAMDLDRYVQNVSYSTDNGNKDIENSTKETMDRLKELLNMFESGKKVNFTTLNKFHGVLDQLNDLYDQMKYEN